MLANGSNNTPAKADNGRCYLLELPAELGLEILRYLMIQPYTIYKGRSERSPASAQMLATCKTLHQDGIDVPYGGNCFTVYTWAYVAFGKEAFTVPLHCLDSVVQY